MNLINEVEGYLMNENVKEDKEREYTYIEVRGCTVIDYVIVNEMYNNKVVSFKVDNRIDSDHLPLVLAVRDGGEEASNIMEEDYKKNMVKRTIIRLDKEARRTYKENTEEMSWPKDLKESSIEDKWAKLKKTVQKSMVKNALRSETER